MRTTWVIIHTPPGPCLTGWASSARTTSLEPDQVTANTGAAGWCAMSITTRDRLGRVSTRKPARRCMQAEAEAQHRLEVACQAHLRKRRQVRSDHRRAGVGPPRVGQALVDGAGVLEHDLQEGPPLQRQQPAARVLQHIGYVADRGGGQTAAELEDDPVKARMAGCADGDQQAAGALGGAWPGGPG